MATIAEVFEVQFSLKNQASGPAKQVKKDMDAAGHAAEAAAKKLALPGIFGRMESGAGALAKNLQNIKGAFSGFGDLRDAVKELDASTPIISEVVGIIKGIGFVAVGTAAAVTGIAAAAAVTNAQFDSMRRSLDTYTDSAEETERQMRRLQEVARLPGLGFGEAIAGSTSLQAAGFDSRLAERALMGFGNALASAGKGKDDLQGVILALSQIATKSAVSAEEINQIAERVPQIRKVMLEAFGTASPEALTKMGVGPQQFILTVIDALEKLPGATGGAQNSFDNFADALQRMMSQIGEVVNRYVAPALDKLANFMGFLEESRVFSGLAESFSSVASSTGRMVGNIAGLAGDRLSSFGMALNFIMQAQDLPDLLVRGASLFISVMGQLPKIIDLSLQHIDLGVSQLRDFVNNLVEKLAQVIETVGKGFKIKPSFFGVPLPWGVSVGSKDLETKAMGLASGMRGGVDKYAEARRRLQAESASVGTSIISGAQRLLDGFGSWVPSNDVANDMSKGGFTSGGSGASQLGDPYREQVETLQQIETNTRKSADLQSRVMGGGGLARDLLTPVSVSRFASGRSGGGNRLSQLLQEAAAEARRMDPTAAMVAARRYQ